MADKCDVVEPGKSLLARGQVTEAIEAFSQTLAGLETSTSDPVVELDARYGRGVAYRHLGNLQSALEDFEGCHNLAEAQQVLPWAVRSLRAMGEAYLGKKQLDLAVQSFERAVDLAETTKQVEERLRTIPRLARALSDAGKADEARQAIEETINGLKAAKHVAQEIRQFVAGQTYISLGIIAFRQGNARRALQAFRRASELLAQTDARLPLAEARRYVGVLRSEIKQFAEAFPELYGALEMYQQLQFAPGCFDVFWSLGKTYLDMGDLRNARLCLRQAESIAVKAQLAPETGKARATIGGLCLREGEYEAALELYREDLDVTSRTTDRQALAYCHRNLSITYRLLGYLWDAEKHAQESIRLFQENQRSVMAALARLDLADAVLAQGDIEKAREIAEAAKNVLEASESESYAALAYHMLGKITAVAEDPDTAGELFEKSIELQLKVPPSRQLAESRYAAAIICKERGQKAESLEHLRNAVGLAEALGSRDVRDTALRLVEGLDIVAASRLKLAPYVPTDAVDELSSRWEDIDRKRTPVVATVLFADMRGSTVFSAAMNPDETVESMEAFLSLAVRAVVQNGGTVDKFIGDGVMATFGLGQDPDKGARTAVWAALDLLDQVRYTSLIRSAAGACPFHIAIGINTGAVIAGCFGPLEKRDYTVIGFNVNLASRLQSLASELDVPEPDRLVLSDRTYRAAQSIVSAKPVDQAQMQLKGIDASDVVAWLATGRTAGGK